MAIELLCRKIGMTRFYDETGQSVAVTVLEAGPNPVVQKKTPATDGYSAVQLGFSPAKQPLRAKNVSKALKGHFQKANIAPLRALVESRLAAEDAAKIEVGQELRCDLFSAGQIVDVIGVTKGRGTTGVVKRHNFAVHTEGHGTHEFFRHGGSIGSNSDPGRVIKGLKMPGRYGSERTTTRNLKVVKVEPERNLIFVRGAVPGHANGIVRIRAAITGS